MTPQSALEQKDPIAFPVFNEKDLNRVCGFGEQCEFQPGEMIIPAGTRNYDCFFIISGEARVVDISNDEEVEVTIHKAGEFAGDLDLLTGRPGVVDIVALIAVKAVRIKSADIRKFLVRFPDLGDRLMHAFIRRREILQESSFEGIRLYGHKDCSMTLTLQEFFYRNGVPNTWMDIEQPANKSRLQRLEISTKELPLLTYGNKELFRKPTLPQIAAHIGIQRVIKKELYDTIIIGAGPSGLGAAVYSSSEGLSTLVLDQIGPGGQAGSSSKIENYAGFPAGLSGRELALRSYLQALKFGADFIAPCSVKTIRKLKDGNYGVDLCTNETAVGRTVIIATGINYRSLKVPGMDQLRGSGIYYNATQVEAILCEGRPVHVIGAGNSAGQAAMFLSGFASEVNLLIRGESMAKSMSEYLWARIEQNSKIKIRYKSELASVHGNENIRSVEVLNTLTGVHTREETSGVFIFIGGVPCTDFLPQGIELDPHGFVKAGTDLATNFKKENGRFPCPLETSYPGVFVSGDCRAGTTKRVAFAIGDGALAITCVHDFLGTYS